MHYRKTKIVATIGPASAGEKELVQMIRAGMNVARLNFSHGTHDEHASVIKIIREVAEREKQIVAILQDLSGPKIRIGSFETETVHLKNNADFVLTTEECVGDETHAYINYKKLTEEVSEGSFIMIDDGKLKLRVEKVVGNEIFCKVIFGGMIRGGRGVNVPGTHLGIGCLSNKDKDDLMFGIEKKVDFIALSFVQTAEDVHDLRKIVDEYKSKALIIAKIETEEAVANIDEIIEAADGIMVARGDLAVEIPAEDVPLMQKMMIKKAIAAGKPVITATQMLDSMITSSVPTRAEVSDVSNAIFDGTDAIMLSGETATGDYPAHTIETMARIALRTEQSDIYDEAVAKFKHVTHGVADSVSSSVSHTATNIGAMAIVALSERGFTPRMISRYKPKQPILVMTPHVETCNQMALSFGCMSVLVDPVSDIDTVVVQAKKHALAQNILKLGDSLVISCGIPFGKTGGTNLLLVQTV